MYAWILIAVFSLINGVGFWAYRQNSNYGYNAAPLARHPLAAMFGKIGMLGMVILPAFLVGFQSIGLGMYFGYLAAYWIGSMLFTLAIESAIGAFFRRLAHDAARMN